MSQEYVALADGAARFRRGFSGPALLRVSLPCIRIVAYRTLTVYGVLSQALQLTRCNQMSRPYNPKVAVTTLVWAPPRSLATTWGIMVIFFSCRYLDVSVPCVCHCQTSWSVPDSSSQGVAPFGHLRINGYVPLPPAYRSLSRPSSPLRP